MALSAKTITLLAQSLLEAEAACQPRACLTDDYPDLTEQEAYQIARARQRLRSSRPKSGYKLGYTTEAMRRQMQIDSPNFGLLTTDMLVANGQQSFGSLIHPLVEPEIAVCLGADLAVHSGHTRESILEAGPELLPALEICDTRYLDYRFKAVDNIADNSSAARYVLGPSVPVSSVADPALLKVELWLNGRCIDYGSGADALGDPLVAVAWLANRLAAEGTALEAGDVILTGGLTKGYRASPSDHFVNKVLGLSEVSLEFV